MQLIFIQTGTGLPVVSNCPPYWEAHTSLPLQKNHRVILDSVFSYMDHSSLGKEESPPEPSSSTCCCISLSHNVSRNWALNDIVLLRLLMVGQSLWPGGTCAEKPESLACRDTPAQLLPTQSTGGRGRFGGHTGGRVGELGEHLVCSHLQSQGEARNNASGIKTFGSVLTALLVCIHRINVLLTNCLPSTT